MVVLIGAVVASLGQAIFLGIACGARIATVLIINASAS